MVFLLYIYIIYMSSKKIVIERSRDLIDVGKIQWIRVGPDLPGRVCCHQSIPLASLLP